MVAELPQAKTSRSRLVGKDGRPAMTAAEYVERAIPRLPGEPWSAPLFDSREVAAQPEIYCVDSPDRNVCQCYTEQITKLDVAYNSCRKIAHDGIYNPFRKPHVDRSGDGLVRDEVNAPVRANVAPAPLYPIQQMQVPQSGMTTAAAAGGAQGPVTTRHHALTEPYHPEVFAPATSQY